MTLRRELAAAAAALVADTGLDYGSAKRKAARQLGLADAPPRGAMPDNHEIEDALREHLELFDADGHRHRRRHLREAALALMDRLAEWSPYVTGAAWKGLATEHALLHVQMFGEQAKDVGISLLNDGLDFDATEVPGLGGRRPVEALVGEWHGWPVLIAMHPEHDLRGALRDDDGRGAERGTREQLARRLQAEDLAENLADAGDAPGDQPGALHDGGPGDTTRDRATPGWPPPGTAPGHARDGRPSGAATRARRERGRVRPAVLVLLVAAAALAAGLGVARWRAAPPASAPVPEAAVERLWQQAWPDPDGRPMALGGLRGKVAVVNFWATWCAPCVREMPALSALRDELTRAGQPVEFVGVAIDRADNVAEFARRTPVAYPLVVAGGAGSELARELGNGAGALPFTAVIDATGRVVERTLGIVDPAVLRARIEGLGRQAH